VITYTEYDKVPCPRNGHSACIYGNFMYIFGGRSNDNVKLNDTWKINLSSLDWEEIGYANLPPIERSGHSCDIIGKYMIIYGGINEITKE
jgi:N-acetylneuraminic acid mutarotase